MHDEPAALNAVTEQITGAVLVSTARRVLQNDDPVVPLPLSLEELPA